MLNGGWWTNPSYSCDHIVVRVKILIIMLQSATKTNYNIVHF